MPERMRQTPRAPSSPTKQACSWLPPALQGGRDEGWAPLVRQVIAIVPAAGHKSGAAQNDLLLRDFCFKQTASTMRGTLRTVVLRLPVIIKGVICNCIVVLFIRFAPVSERIMLSGRGHRRGNRHAMCTRRDRARVLDFRRLYRPHRSLVRLLHGAATEPRHRRALRALSEDGEAGP